MNINKTRAEQLVGIIIIFLLVLSAFWDIIANIFYNTLFRNNKISRIKK